MIVEFENSEKELDRYEEVITLFPFGSSWDVLFRDKKITVSNKELVSIKTEEYEKEKAKEMGLEHLW